MYDESKLEAAVDAWAKKRADLGFGQHYTRDLLADFEAFLAETKMLQASPGMAAFGRQMTRIGLGQRRLNGKTWRTGITLKKPPKPREPHTYAPTKRRQRTAKATQKRVAAAQRNQAVMSEDDRAKRKREIKERMKRENRKSVEAVPEE